MGLRIVPGRNDLSTGLKHMEHMPALEHFHGFLDIFQVAADLGFPDLFMVIVNHLQGFVERCGGGDDKIEIFRVKCGWQIRGLSGVPSSRC